MQNPPAETHWLDHYASQEYKWQETVLDGCRTLHRPLGLVEATFDADGRHYEGRADINALLELEVASQLEDQALRERILLAWTCLRTQHLLLQAKAIPLSRVANHDAEASTNLCFAVQPSEESNYAISNAAKQLTFLEDHYEVVDFEDFWLHCQNTARIVDPEISLARLFILPLEPTGKGTYALHCLFVGSHQIWDGLSQYIWMRDFLRLLNQSTHNLQQSLNELLEPAGVRKRLPLPQEALYPPVSGSRAQQRWFWLLTRILRHVRKPLVAGFTNPRRRPNLLKPVALSPTYDALLDYTRLPPLNTVRCSVKVEKLPTRHLHRLCRAAGVSIGAGCFALAALTMMEMEELRAPNVSLEQRQPFISGFPLNPRAFFNHLTEPNSLMLAFCDGIILPFLSSDLDLDGRIRLLARQAQRQLAVYQKRVRPKAAEAELQYMGSRGAGRVLAIQYISSMERVDAILPEPLRKGINPQGAYPARENTTRQTCGVSSVGRTDSLLQAGMYDLHETEKDFVADFRRTKAGVRAREGEFLIGIGGSDVDIGVNVSVDASSVDLALVDVWKDKIEHILDSREGIQKARL